MQRFDIKDVREFVVKNFLFYGESELDDETSFRESGLLDSTGMLELITFLETTYSIQVEDHELNPENLDSLHRIKRFVEDKLAGAPNQL